MICLTGTAFADEKTHRKLAEEFMVITDVAQMMGQTFDQVKAAQLKKMKEVAYKGKSPEKDGELQKKVQNYIENKLNWSNFKKGYIDVYSTVFTEEELKALVVFYSSPVGKKVLGNTKELRMKLLQSTQEQMKDMAFDIKKIEKDFVADQDKNDTHK
jgi:hypothetical protein